MERYDDQSGNNLWKRAAAPADLPDRSGERAGHGLLPGVRDAFFRVSISKSRRAAESGPHACGSGVAPSSGVSAAVRTASPAAIGRAHRLILLMESRASPPGRLIPQERARRPSLHYFWTVLGLCSCPQLKRRPMMHFTIK